jgi:uncharacterized protein YaaR (DUF327 family)
MDEFEILVEQIDDKAQQLQEAVSSGRAETFEEYKKTCGEIKGLLTARGYILDLKQKMETSDD